MLEHSSSDQYSFMAPSLDDLGSQKSRTFNFGVASRRAHWFDEAWNWYSSVRSSSYDFYLNGMDVAISNWGCHRV